MRFFYIAILLMVILMSCKEQAKYKLQPYPSQLNLAQKSPDSFLVSFKTTKGSFIMKAVRKWSPLGVDRLYLLVKSGYYDGCVIYRVAPTASFKGGFVVQFGLANGIDLNKAWEKASIKDEPVVRPHLKGSVNFARGGPDTRSMELAISLTPAGQFDTVNYNGVVGFPSIAEVTDGMKVLEQLNSQYGNSVFDHEDSILKGREYFDRAYPGLDRILSASVVKEW
ncbi:MAG TPA: peptidylprolyl isomerase [Chitinophagaceae bacterium]|nr:peptidylprolyl isomerase [Chitinophagaceae bacterium]